PASRSPASASSAWESDPTQPTNRTSAPSRAAATAWLAPLPPGKRSNVAPLTVSPGRGSRSTRATRSRLTDPTTVRLVLGGKRAQVLGRAPEQVLAQVEEAGPQGRPVGLGAEPRRGAQPLERSDEHRELEIRLRHPDRGEPDAGAQQDRPPLDELRAPGLAVPRPALGPLGLQFEEVAAERLLPPGPGRLRPAARPAVGRFPL